MQVDYYQGCGALWESMESCMDSARSYIDLSRKGSNYVVYVTMAIYRVLHRAGQVTCHLLMHGYSPYNKLSTAG
jgi:hypothetical protein